MWPGASPGPVENLAGFGGGRLPSGQAHGGIQIALNGQPRSQPATGLVQRDPPVHADDRAAGCGHRSQELAGADAEEDGRDPGMGLGQFCEQPGGDRQDQLVVVPGREYAGPTVEDLDGSGSGIQLRAQGSHSEIAQPVEQFVPDRRFACIRPLTLTKFLDGPPSIR